MRKISFLSVFLLLLVSCEKNPDNLTILLNQSGTVSIKIIDSNQNGVKGAKVSVHSSVPKGERIYFDSTDINGMCNIGKLLQGQYEYYATTEKDNKTYSYSEYFQVIAGDDKAIEANPFLNIGDALVKIVNMNSEPITNINVALIPHANYSNVDYDFQGLLHEAYAIGKTDSLGWAEFFDLPADAKYNMEYSVLVYYDSENYYYPIYNNYVYVSFGSKGIFTIKIDL